LEQARGIEPPTGGLQINWWGIVQVFEKAGNPLASPAKTQDSLFPVLASVYLYSPRVGSLF
jgi:hypothetical protein